MINMEFGNCIVVTYSILLICFGFFFDGYKYKMCTLWISVEFLNTILRRVHLQKKKKKRYFKSFSDRVGSWRHYLTKYRVCYNFENSFVTMRNCLYIKCLKCITSNQSRYLFVIVFTYRNVLILGLKVGLLVKFSFNSSSLNLVHNKPNKVISFGEK